VLTGNTRTASATTEGGDNTREILAAAVQELRRLSPGGPQSPGDYAGRVPDELLQDLFAAAVKFFAAKRALDNVDAFGNNHVTATEVSIAATGMLEAVNLELFELTLWNGWGRA
jgi:hypothetical protein